MRGTWINQAKVIKKKKADTNKKIIVVFTRISLASLRLASASASSKRFISSTTSIKLQITITLILTQLKLHLQSYQLHFHYYNYWTCKIMKINKKEGGITRKTPKKLQIGKIACLDKMKFQHLFMVHQIKDNIDEILTENEFQP
jgi:hypothetical protein